MLRNSCEEHQNLLLEAGADGSNKVTRDHIDEKNELSDASNSNTKKTDPSTTTTTSTNEPKTTIIGKKRCFPTLKEFTDASEDRVKRKLRPIQKWNTLTTHVLYLVKKVVQIDVGGSGISDRGYYAQLENQNEETFNVWLTDIIKNELNMHKLYENNVYIIPLGMTKCKDNGNSYFDFVVQTM